MKNNILALAAAVIAATTLFATPAKAELTRADVQAIVQEYIEKNGDKVMEGIYAYQNKKQLAAAAAAISKHTPTQGPANAPVTIIEFSDFECPFCNKVQQTVTSVKARYGNRVRWAYKHLPLDFHAKAKPAAYAAQAAHRQGKFWEYSAALWAGQEYLGEPLYVKIAEDLKLNMKKFNADRASAAVQEEVTSDLRDAAKVGARGTPYFLINGTALSGAVPQEDFIQAIENALNSPGKK